MPLSAGDGQLDAGHAAQPTINKLILKKMLGFKYPTQHIKYLVASKSTFSSSHLTSSVSSVITSICPVFNVDQVLYARGRGGHVQKG